MLGLSGRHLVSHSGHGPFGSIVIMVVCIDADIISADIYRCNIVNNLLIICSNRIVDLLGNSRGQSGTRAGKNRIVIVAAALLSAQLVFC